MSTLQDALELHEALVYAQTHGIEVDIREDTAIRVVIRCGVAEARFACFHWPDLPPRIRSVVSAMRASLHAGLY